ncbi:MAG TPA: NrfD/PsrC family molybdoenzyme membrane anchor subunit [Acidimicrobiales bacterium]|nr:NrfD/PsrC family molybdoenzyme membrane anchor subunit [Acidimicrobiales bacterium]
MTADVTREGVRDPRPGREAVPAPESPLSGSPRANGGGGRGERPVVPDADFRSYYGLPVLNPPTWKSLDIAGYLFCGGLAGASSVMAAAADLTGRRTLAGRLKVGAATALGLGVAGLVHDLGRPARFMNMLRVVKPTSPMSVGSWLLSVYGPAAGVAAATAVTGRMPVLGAAATAGAALTGPAVAAYTGALISSTAVPAWHDGHREMPYVFVGSAASAAAGMALVLSPAHDNGPARRVAVIGAVSELLAAKRMEQREGELVAEPYTTGTGGALMRAGEALTVAGLGVGVVLGRRNRAAAIVGGAALMAASACTRFGIFHAGLASARDPRYTVEPQRARVRAREA